MRKNKMMRTAAVLGVATMLTASVLSGTFAKYTTTAEGTDSARVAKWGITMSNTGSNTFSDTYDAAQGATVKGENSAKVVAPGTHGGATYTVTGTPETAYEITFDGKATKDVYLKNGYAYTKPKTGTVSADYYPVNYSVEIKKTGNNATTSPTLTKKSTADDKASYISELGTAQTFETLESAMAALNNTVATYSTPNTAADLTVEIKWAWAFDDKDTTGNNVISVTGGHTANDVYDTVLGDLANTQNADVSSGNQNYSTEIGYTLSMTATQKD